MGHREYVAPVRRWAAVFIAVLAACSAAEEEATAPTRFEPTFVPARCTVRVPDSARVECGTLTVLEDRGDPDGATVRLPLAIVRTDAARPAPDPIVYFSGGPGAPGLEVASRFLESRLGGERDVIVFDQRGTGGAEPSLECPEVDEATWANFGTAAAPEVELQRSLDAFAACRARLVEDGVDLGAYDTATSAADVADLRGALDIGTWNLFGVSYGTTLALEVLRSEPDGVRSVVLDSVYPTTVPGGAEGVFESWTRAARALFDGCADDPACAAAYPTLEADFDAAVERYDRAPFEGEIPDPDTGRVRRIVITGADIVAGAFDAMYERDLIPLLPSLTAALARGDTTIIPLLASEGIPSTTVFADAMAASVECADRARIRHADPDRLVADHPTLSTLLTAAANPQVCDLWDVPPAADGFE
jgi:pimeloyl-ACP methyl ester carboxylesterase